MSEDGVKNEVGEQKEGRLAGVHILIIDDSPRQALLAAEILADEGAVVTTLYYSPTFRLDTIFNLYPLDSYDLLVIDGYLTVTTGPRVAKAALEFGFMGTIIGYTAAKDDPIKAIFERMNIKCVDKSAGNYEQTLIDEALESLRLHNEGFVVYTYNS